MSKEIRASADRRRRQCLTSRVRVAIVCTVVLMLLLWWGLGGSSQPPLIHVSYMDYTTQCFANGEPAQAMQDLDHYMALHPDELCYSSLEFGLPHVHIVLRDASDLRRTHHLVNVRLQEWSRTHPNPHAFVRRPETIFAYDSLRHEDVARSSDGRLGETVLRHFGPVWEPMPVLNAEGVWSLHSHDTHECDRWSAVVARFELLSSVSSARGKPMTQTFVGQYAHCLQLYQSVFFRSPDPVHVATDPPCGSL